MTDLSNPDLAEFIFLYVIQDDVFDDFSAKRLKEPLSMLQYVAKYRHSDFDTWLSCLSDC